MTMSKEDLRHMDFFSWSSRFETGLPEIDRDHAGLIELINKLTLLAAARVDMEQLAPLLAELEQYTIEHFSTEEALMRQRSLDETGAAAHRQAHEAMREQIRVMRELSGHSDEQARETLTKLLPVLTRWLFFHVLCTDMQMANEIIALERGDSPDMARRKAQDARTVSLRAALDALSELNDALVQRSAELIKTNAHLRRYKEYQALAQRVAHTGSWELDLTAFRIEASDEFQRLFGQNPEVPLQHFDDLISCVPEADRQVLFDALSAILHGGRTFNLEHRVSLADCSERWLQTIGERMPASEGNGERLIGIVRDVTEERSARIQLNETNQQLALSLTALERHATDLIRLNELNEGLQSCLNASEAFEVVEHAMARLGLGGGGSLSIPERRLETLHTVARWGNGGLVAPHFPASSCWGMRRGQRHIVQGPADGPCCKHFDGDTSYGYVCLPLQVLGEPLGLLTLRATPESSEPDWSRFVHLASMVAESLKLALSNVRLREALHDQATRDPLTGLLNRRYLDESLPRELARTRREHRKLSLVMLDLDHFKRVNDKWGHEAGDAVLSQTAAILRSHLRDSDLACRFGGEEFVVLMPGAALAEAHERIEQILRDVCSTHFHLNGMNLPGISFSAGVAESPMHGESAETLLRSADRALYAAKEAGRKRVFDAEPGTDGVA
jgi:diguanylate cyclase (GGDEF)-like protein/hemerythrin-like metal-binding protein/PAS domain S-box-containing protein